RLRAIRTMRNLIRRSEKNRGGTGWREVLMGDGRHCPVIRFETTATLESRTLGAFGAATGAAGIRSVLETTALAWVLGAAVAAAFFSRDTEFVLATTAFFTDTDLVASVGEAFATVVLAGAALAFKGAEAAATVFFGAAFCGTWATAGARKVGSATIRGFIGRAMSSSRLAKASRRTGDFRVAVSRVRRLFSSRSLSFRWISRLIS